MMTMTRMMSDVPFIHSDRERDERLSWLKPLIFMVGPKVQHSSSVFNQHAIQVVIPLFRSSSKYLKFENVR